MVHSSHVVGAVRVCSWQAAQGSCRAVSGHHRTLGLPGYFFSSPYFNRFSQDLVCNCLAERQARQSFFNAFLEFRRVVWSLVFMVNISCVFFMRRLNMHFRKWTKKGKSLLQLQFNLNRCLLKVLQIHYQLPFSYDKRFNKKLSINKQKQKNFFFIFFYWGKWKSYETRNRFRRWHVK